MSKHHMSAALTRMGGGRGLRLLCDHVLHQLTREYANPSMNVESYTGRISTCTLPNRAQRVIHLHYGRICGKHFLEYREYPRKSHRNLASIQYNPVEYALYQRGHTWIETVPKRRTSQPGPSHPTECLSKLGNDWRTAQDKAEHTDNQETIRIHFALALDHAFSACLFSNGFFTECVGQRGQNE
jgi:hypothetical protein